MTSKSDLINLYALAFAPLGETLLEDLKDLSNDDFTCSTLFDEIKYLKSFTTHGFSYFERILGPKANDEPSKDVGVAIGCLNNYLKRVETLSQLLQEMAGETLSHYQDVMPGMREIEGEIKNGNYPSDNEMKEILNLTPNMKWESPSTAKPSARVGFKENTTVFSGGENAQGIQKEEEPLKVDPARRSQRRHPTGFSKFTFKMEDLELDVEDSEDGGSTRISRSRIDSDDQRSARSTGTSSVASLRGTTAEDCEEQEKYNPFKEGTRSSSVGFSFDKAQEIEDEMADPHWHDKNRHEKRFSRIRQRVPTGHPTIMKAASDDLLDLMAEYERQMSGMGEDPETQTNTQVNTLSEQIQAEEKKDANSDKKAKARFRFADDDDEE